MSEEGFPTVRRKALTALIVIALVVTLFLNTAADSNGNQQNPVTSTAGESAKKPIIMERAPSNGTLLLHVIDSSTLQNISDAYVCSALQPSNQSMIVGSTNSTGYVAFGSLLPGDYEIIVSKNWYFNCTVYAIVSSNSTSAYEVLMRTMLTSLTFVVLETPSGNPIQGVEVVITSSYLFVSWANITNYSGFVYFNSIPFGNYTISLSKNGYYPYSMNMTISPGPNTPITFALASISQGGGGSGGGNPILPVVSVIGLLSLAGVISMLVVARRHGQGEDPRHSREWLSDYTPRVVEEQEQPVSVIYSPSISVCSHCGTSIDTDRGDFCPNCGSNVKAEQAVTPIQGEEKRVVRVLGKCMICNLEINENEEALWCPFCGNQAHESHMLEWLHVKNYCPVCRRRLDEHNFR